MPELIDKSSGQPTWVPASQVEAAVASGRFAAPEGYRRAVVSPSGATLGAAPVEPTPGMRPELPAERASRARENIYEEEFSGPGQAALTVAEGAGRGVSLGITDVIGLTGGERAQARREFRPTLSATAEIAGSVAPALATGGTSAAASGARGAIARGLAATPAGQAARLGTRVAASRGYRGAAAGFAAEGAAIGLGDGVSELALSDDPLTLERVASVLSSNMLLGAGSGGGAGIFAKAAGKGLPRARKLLEDAREAAVTRSSQSGNVVDDIAAYQASRGESGVFLLTKGEQKAVLAKQARTLRDALDAPITLGERPARVLANLEKETKVIRELIDEGEDRLLARLAENDGRIAGKVAEKLAAAKPTTKAIKLDKRLASEYRDVRGIGGSGPLKVKTDDARSFLRSLESGELQAQRTAAVQRLPQLLEDNLAVAKNIRAAIAPTKDSFVTGAIKYGVGGYAVPAATGLLPGGIVGAGAAMLAPKVAEKMSALVTGRLAKAGTEAAERTTKALDALMDAAQRTTRAAPVLATKALTSTSFALEPKDAPRPLGKREPLLDAYRAREREILTQTTIGPDGAPMMRPQARHAVAERLAGARAVSPLVADRIETLAARRVEFLARKLPKRPEFVAMHAGPDRWQPSDLEMRQFARYVAAVEDPGAVEERLADGSLTPEDAEAYREVYPERHADLVRQIVERLPELQESLPYERRLALSIFTGVPMDAALHPRILRVLQRQFAEEPGTEGGVAAPAATPQLGSVSRALDEPTPAQERSAG